MRVLYQNSETGELFDLTRRVTGCRWETRLTGSPGRVELAVLRDESLSWSPGGVVQVYGEENEGLFHGYLFSAAAGEGEEVSLTAYDQLRYLKNKDTYVFTGLRADQIAGRIAADFRLSTGALENTGYVIPSLVADGESLLDIILGALETTLDQTGKRFFLWDDFGRLRLSAAPAAGGSPVVLGEGSLLTAYTHTVEIDTDSCNTVKLVREEKDSASRAVWYGQNAQAAARWGVLQHWRQVDDTLNAAQLAQLGQALLGQLCREGRTLTLTALGDTGVRAGSGVYLSLAREGLEGLALVERAVHDLREGTMELKVRLT